MTTIEVNGLRIRDTRDRNLGEWDVLEIPIRKGKPFRALALEIDLDSPVAAAQMKAENNPRMQMDQAVLRTVGYKKALAWNLVAGVDSVDIG